MTVGELIDELQMNYNNEDEVCVYDSVADIYVAINEIEQLSKNRIALICEQTMYSFNRFAASMFTTFIFIRLLNAFIDNETIQECLIKLLIGLVLNAAFCGFVFIFIMLMS